jgi:hypothetical protein
MAYANPTYGAISAILKTKYPDGSLPQALYKNFPFLSLVKKTTNFDGDFRVVALQNERPQGSSSNFTIAQGVSKSGLNGGGGTYNRFQVYRTRHYGILRMDGETMKAAVKTSGALVDLWNNETDGISTNELNELEFQLFGDGTGTRGIVQSVTAAVTVSGVTTATFQLATPADVVNFFLGMKLDFRTPAGAAVTTTPVTTDAGNGVYVYGINRQTGVVTVIGVGGLVDLAGAGITLNYKVVRSGDWNATPGVVASGTGQASGPVVGAQGWITTPTSTDSFWQLNRSADPVRLAGQVFSGTGLPMNEALMEAEGRVLVQGVGTPDTILVNPLDLQNLKKSLGSDIVYDRVQSNVAGISFKSIQYDGANGPMNIVAAPMCPRNKAFMLQLPSWELSTLGPAPQMLDWDNNDYLRVTDADQYEVRFGHYGQFICNNPGANIIISNFGL